MILNKLYAVNSLTNRIFCNIIYNGYEVIIRRKSSVELKVLKFGGSSLADAEHFKMVKEIVMEVAMFNKEYSILPILP